MEKLIKLLGENILRTDLLSLHLQSLSGCSVARLSRLLWEQEAAGSNPATPTKVFSFFGKTFFIDYIFIIA